MPGLGVEGEGGGGGYLVIFRCDLHLVGGEGGSGGELHRLRRVRLLTPVRGGDAKIYSSKIQSLCTRTYSVGQAKIFRRSLYILANSVPSI